MRSFDDLDIDNYNPFDDSEDDSLDLLYGEDESPNESQVERDTPSREDLKAQADALLAAAEAAASEDSLPDTGESDVSMRMDDEEGSYVQFGAEPDDLHADAFDSGALDNRPFPHHRPDLLLDAIDRVQAANLELWIKEHGAPPEATRAGKGDDDDDIPVVGGSAEEGAFLAKMQGYVVQNARKIARKYDGNLDWGQDRDDLLQDARRAILAAVRSFERAPGVSDKSNVQRFWGYLSRAMETKVGRTHIKKQYGLNERDFKSRGEVKRARVALLKQSSTEPSEADLHLWVYLEREAKEAEKQGRTPLRDLVAPEAHQVETTEMRTRLREIDASLADPSLGYSQRMELEGRRDLLEARIQRIERRSQASPDTSRAPDFSVIREAMFRRHLPEIIAERMMSKAGGEDPGATVRAECLESARKALGPALLRERFGRGDSSDLHESINLWVETCSGYGSVRLGTSVRDSLVHHLHALLDEALGELSQQTGIPLQAKEEILDEAGLTNPYHIVPEILRARHELGLATSVAKGKAPEFQLLSALHAEISDQLVNGAFIERLGTPSMPAEDGGMEHRWIDAPPLNEIVRFSVEADMFLRHGRRPSAEQLLIQLVGYAGDSLDTEVLRALRDHNPDTESLDQPRGGEGEGRSLLDTLEGGVSAVKEGSLSEEDEARLALLMKEAHRTRTPSGNDLLKRALFSLMHGMSLTGRDNPQRIHHPLSATEIALVGGYTRTTANNLRDDFEPRVLAVETIPSVEVPVEAPDGRTYPVVRSVQGTILAHRKRRLEEERRGVRR